MKLKLVFVIILIFMVGSMKVSKACITFCLRDSTNFLCSFSYDFDTCLAYVTINKRNITKSSIFYLNDDDPLTWTSKYGSITFNQIGNQLPTCGMNEKGLVVTLMWLDETEYPANDNRKALTELQWIQYQLDNSSSVQEVIESNSVARISKTSIAPLHYFISDKYGNSAVIEFLKGKLAVYQGAQLPLEVLPNTPYNDILSSFLQSKGEYSENTNTSNDIFRFNKTVKMIQDYNQQHLAHAIDYSFNILESVKCNNTRWNIVFDVYGNQIHYRTRENQIVRTISIMDFNYSCDKPQKIIDINKPLNNGWDDFVAYSTELNRELIYPVYAKVPEFSDWTTEQKEKIIHYPETMNCKY